MTESEKHLSKQEVNAHFESPVNRSVKNRAVLLVLAFLTGAMVLLQEILAAGWMAPIHGSGIDVWAAILASSLLALAAGAIIGSRAARRWSGFMPFYGLLALASVMLVAGAFIVSQIDHTTDTSLALTSLVLLGLPLTTLGVFSPCLVERYAATGVGPGRAAGITYASGTLGSGFGAILGGFFLVPKWGLQTSTLAAAAALIAGGVLLALISRQSRVWALALLAPAAACAAFAYTKWEVRDVEGPFGLHCVEHIDGWYGRHEVFEDDVARYLLVDGILQTSAPRHNFGWTKPGDLLRAGNALELSVWMRPKAGRALVIGLGGGSFIHYLEKVGWDVHAVEIDPVVVDLASRHFDFDQLVTVDDGRHFLNRTEKSYDFILLDVYRGENLPSHLFSEEAFELMSTRLSDGGLLAVNLIGTADSSDSLAVIRSVVGSFRHFELFAPGGGATSGPMTLFASNSAIEHPSSRDRVDYHGLAWPEPVKLDLESVCKAERLLDIRNPLALLRRDTAAEWRARNRQRFQINQP